MSSHKRAVENYRTRMRAEGRCIVCGQPAINASYCESHARAARHKAKHRYRSGLNGAVRDLKCGKCGTKGHNARTCNG